MLDIKSLKFSKDDDVICISQQCGVSNMSIFLLFCIVFIILFKTKLKSAGNSTAPCLKPFLTAKGLDVSFK